MDWMKRLTKWLLIFIVCYLVVNILTFNVIKSSYNFEQPKV